jgi:hypothetical protein
MTALPSPLRRLGMSLITHGEVPERSNGALLEDHCLISSNTASIGVATE